MLASLSEREAVEVFHLLFVSLLASGPEKSNYIIKGGSNLRFFFGSVRYSEDIDFDVTGVEPHVLRERVQKILASPSLRSQLTTYRLAISRAAAPKQTDTTQRWKIGLRAEGRDADWPTKIEFSRRGLAGESKLDAVDASVAHRYKMTPPLACHYLLPAAVVQKIRALAGRREVQARDVFDLDLLLARAGGSLRPFLGPVRRLLPEARDRVFALGYAEYSAQVVAYLPQDAREQYASEEVWEAMQLRVAEALE